MDTYSLTLLLALVTCGLAVAAAVVSRFGFGAGKPPVRMRLAGTARVAAVASLGLAAFSFLLHLLTGHRPGTPEAMGAVRFALEHPALVVAMVASTLVSWWLARARGGHRRGASPAPADEKATD